MARRRGRSMGFDRNPFIPGARHASRFSCAAWAVRRSNRSSPPRRSATGDEDPARWGRSRVWRQPPPRADRPAPSRNGGWALTGPPRAAGQAPPRPAPRRCSRARPSAASSGWDGRMRALSSPTRAVFAGQRGVEPAAALQAGGWLGPRLGRPAPRRPCAAGAGSARAARRARAVNPRRRGRAPVRGWRAARRNPRRASGSR